LGKSSRHSGRQTVSRNTMLLWATKFFLWNRNETLHRMTKQRGQWEEYLQLSVFPRQKSGGKCIWNAKPEFSNLSEDSTTIAGECAQQYFCDMYFAQLSEISRRRPKCYGEFCKCSKQSYKYTKPRRKIPPKYFWSKQQIWTIIFHLDVCLDRMKEFNVRLIYNIQLSWMLSW
jgi:hypothetical protein